MSRADKNFANKEYEQPKKNTLTRSYSAISIQLQNAASNALNIMDSTAGFIKKMLRSQD